MSQWMERADALARIAIALLILVGMTGCQVSLHPPAEEGTVFEIAQWRDSDDAIDVLFIPDNDYGDLSIAANLQVFLDDVANLIDEGFWQNNALARNFGVVNFWFMTEAGDVQPAPPGELCPAVTWPDFTDVLFTDVRVLLHLNDLRDCSFPGMGTTVEPGSYRTIVHESSHAAFVLPDEYCCDGGYWELPPILYDTEDRCRSDAENVEWRDCECFTDDGGREWCRSEDTIVDIMSGENDPVWEYGPADWVVVRDVLSNLGWAPAAPEVFAPDDWSWP